MTVPSELRCLTTDNPCGTDTRQVDDPCPCLNCRVYEQFNTHFSGRASAPYEAPKDNEPEWWELPGGSL